MAVFFLIIPRFAALSMALYKEGRRFCASSLFFKLTARFNAFVARRKAVFLLSLKTRLRNEERSAFFADFVMGINDIKLPKRLHYNP